MLLTSKRVEGNHGFLLVAVLSHVCVLQNAWIAAGCLLYFGKTLGIAEALQNASCNQISLCVLVCVCSFFCCL